jgi:MFS family permease
MEAENIQTHPDKKTFKINRPIWIALLLLGFAGQLAWAVENQFFNTFMYNHITPDPRPISWMVSATALVATITAVFMGTLSDRTRSRWGRRRPFIFFGYIVWGVFTALYPSSARFQPVGFAIAMAILFDCVMTFFGSTANDAAFNAYVTDITTKQNRGRVNALLEIMTWVAILIVYGGAPVLIDSIGYEFFFYLIGSLVLVVGLVSGKLTKEPAAEETIKERYWQQITSTFRWKSLKANEELLLVFLAITLFAAAQSIFFPYLLIYLEHYLKLEAVQYALLVGVSILVGGIALAYPFGLAVDRWGRRPVAIFAVIGEMAGLLLFSFAREYWALVLTGILWLAPISAWTITTLTWTKDLYPEEKRGQFSGFFILFSVLIPQIIGSLTGGWLGSTFGIPTFLNGQEGFIPTPLLFQIAAVACLTTLIPIFAMRPEQPVPVPEKKPVEIS